MKQSKLPGMGDNGPVDCLGMTFENDDARREHFLGRLKEYLAEPEFRKQPGFPKGTDDAILQMSDPPYYTACPNPFWDDIAEHISTPYDSESDDYHREPMAENMEEGKTHALYRAHGYHTKVPHLAIVPYILHYTDPGDVILDGFCGSGMTGVAAQFCSGIGTTKDKQKVTTRMEEMGSKSLVWGKRHVILNDLAPAATFIASGYLSGFNLQEFEYESSKILEQFDVEMGWMYETRHINGELGRIDYCVWTEMFLCPNCNSDINFIEQALDTETGIISEEFNCNSCNIMLTKRRLNPKLEKVYDEYLSKTIDKKVRRLYQIQYKYNNEKFVKKPDEIDLELLRKISKTRISYTIPIDKMMHSESPSPKWGDKWRNGTANFSHVHHLFDQRPLLSISYLLNKIYDYKNSVLRRNLLFAFEQIILGMSHLNRYQTRGWNGNVGSSQVNRMLSGVYYIGSQISEVHPRHILEGKNARLVKAFSDFQITNQTSYIQTGTCSSVKVTDNSIDYIFTDPPFGHNLAYAELNFIVEAFHGVFTHQPDEAIVSKHQEKDVGDYRDLMYDCFREYHRILKPGRWMTMVFSNSQASVWNAINESLLRAGFIIANVRGFSKKQKNFNQVQGVYVDHDLAITCYKPKQATIEQLTSGGDSGVWAIMDEHLGRMPNWIGSSTHMVVDVERTPDHLYDRLVAIHLVHGILLGMNRLDFFAGLEQRYSEREGMYFRANQVPEFERRMLTVDRSEGVLPVFMDRKSAIAWLRFELGRNPTTLQKLTPRFMAASSTWLDKNEPLPELLELLQDNFVESENGRWKVPDPKKEAELERARKTRNLKRFNELVASKGRIKEVHADVILAGFAKCFDDNDLETYSSIRKRLPSSVLDDEQVSMYKMMLDGRLDD